MRRTILRLAKAADGVLEVRSTEDSVAEDAPYAFGTPDVADVAEVEVSRRTVDADDDPYGVLHSPACLRARSRAQHWFTDVVAVEIRTGEDPQVGEAGKLRRSAVAWTSVPS